MSNPALHLATVPYPRAIGLSWLAMGERDTRLGLACATHVSVRRDAGRQTGALLAGAPHPPSLAIDDRVVLGMIDHGCSTAIYAAMDANAPIATLDLRVELLRSPPPGTDLVCASECHAIAGGIAFAQAQVTAGDEAVARGNATFMVGAYPGQAPGSRLDLVWDRHVGRAPPDRSRWPSYEALFGAERDGARVALPFADHLVGAVSLPALHGGAVAALLATAAETAIDEATQGTDGRGGRVGTLAPEGRPTLATFSVQYLRAAQDATTVAEGRVEKRGAASDFVSVRATQVDGARVVALAQALFVRRPPG